MRQESRRALEIVTRLLRDDLLQIRRCSRRISKLQRARASAIKRIERVRPSRDGAIEGLTRCGNSAVVHVQVAKLLPVPCRRVLPNQHLKLANAFPPRKDLHRTAQQRQVRQRLRKQIHQRADRTEKQDHPDPVRVRSPANKVDDRCCLQQNSPRIEKRAQKSHSVQSPRQITRTCAFHPIKFLRLRTSIARSPSPIAYQHVIQKLLQRHSRQLRIVHHSCRGCICLLCCLALHGPHPLSAKHSSAPGQVHRRAHSHGSSHSARASRPENVHAPPVSSAPSARPCAHATGASLPTVDGSCPTESC